MKDARSALPLGVPDGQVASVMASSTWHAPEPWPPSMLIAAQPGRALEAYANHGRWIAECECGSAQLTAACDPRFMCCDCGNAGDSGLWRSVIWPRNLDALNQALDAPERPLELKNWRTGESVAQLKAENKLLRIGASA